MGRLQCEGDLLYDNTVTFRKADAIITVPPFEAKIAGDLRFQFKTGFDSATFGSAIIVQNIGYDAGDLIEVTVVYRSVFSTSFLSSCLDSSASTTRDRVSLQCGSRYEHSDHSFAVRFQRQRMAHGADRDQSTGGTSDGRRSICCESRRSNHFSTHSSAIEFNHWRVGHQS